MSDYSIWLTLEKDSRSKYRKIIMKLSKRLNSIPFDPHCTIYSRLNTDLEKVIPIINNVAKTRDQFSVKIWCLVKSPLQMRDQDLELQ